MFIESGWQYSAIALLTVINAMVGAPQHTVALAPLTERDIVQISASLQDGTYQPARWFGPQVAGAQGRRVAADTPPIDPHATYEVILLRNEPAGLEMVSRRSGGILFEDPFYAILAGFNAGRFKQPWAEVLVTNREMAWRQRPAIIDELARGGYRPERYFHLTGPVLAQPGQPWLSAHQLSGHDLQHLELNGMADARPDAGAANLYSLYRYKLE